MTVLERLTEGRAEEQAEALEEITKALWLFQAQIDSTRSQAHRLLWEDMARATRALDIAVIGAQNILDD